MNTNNAMKKTFIVVYSDGEFSEIKSYSWHWCLQSAQGIAERQGVGIVSIQINEPFLPKP